MANDSARLNHKILDRVPPLSQEKEEACPSFSLSTY